VAGNLEFDKARFRNAGATALNLNSINVRGSLLVRDGFESVGELSLRYATVGATLEINSARFDNLQGVAVALYRATVNGSLMLRGTETQGEFGLSEARVLRGLLIESTKFINYRATAFRGDGMNIGGSMTLRGSEFHGYASLVSAKVETTLWMGDTRFENLGGVCLDCYGINTGGFANFSSGLQTNGELRLSAATIGGALVLDRANLNNPTLVAFRIDSASVKADFTCRGATIDGTLRLAAANITGALLFDDCRFTNSAAACVDGYEARIGFVEIVNRSFLKGTVSLANAQVAGGVAVRNSNMATPGRIALSLEAAVVKQSVFVLASGIEGELRLMDARIDGVMELRPAQLSKSSISLNAHRVQVRGRVFFELPALTSGDVLFVGATAGNDMELTGGTVEQYGSIAVDLTGLRCSSTVALRRLHCSSIRMPRCRIDGDLECREIYYTGAERVQFRAARGAVKGVFTWRQIYDLTGDFDLTDFKAGQLSDDEAGWPGPGHLFITNFGYDTLDSTSPSGKERLDWLRRQPRFRAQPYQQAAKAILQNGLVRESQTIAIAMRRDQRISPETPPGQRWWNAFLAATIGNGHQIWRALLWALVVIVIGGTVFSIANQHLQIIVPADASKPSMQPFNAWAYSLDLFLPVVDLYQERGFRIAPKAPWHNVFLIWTSFEILAGWLLTSVSLAALSGLVKKE